MTETIAATAREPVPAGATDDAALVARILAHDRGAFEQLMRRHNTALFRVARSILRDDADAEDALQDAYLAAYRHLGEFRGEARLSTWLTRIVINQALARLRARRRDRGRRLSRRARRRAAPIRGSRRWTDGQAESPEGDAMRAEMRRLLETQDRRAAARLSHRLRPARGRGADDRRDR